ncbi:MAG TPA: HIT family protein [Acidimicrobiales bacterium]
MTSGGWPDDWDERKAGAGCPLCASLGADDNEYSVAVAALDWIEVRLERRSRLPGYCIAVWRHRHVAEPFELVPEEAAGYWREVTSLARALEDEFRPVKLNLMTLGNAVPHLHTHVVPRYLDDPAPAGPLPWDDLFLPEPNDPDVLRRQAAAIRERLTGG